MNTPRHPAAWIAVVAGLVWLIDLGDRGWVAFLFAVVPGTLLVTGGFGTYVLPGDVRLQSVAAIGGLLGVALSLPFLLFGVWMALWAGLLSAASFVAAGWIALSLEPDYDEVPKYPLTLRYAARAAGGRGAHLHDVHHRQAPGSRRAAPRRGGAHRSARALRVARMAWRSHRFHRIPPPPESVEIRPRTARGIAHEHLRFDSGYAPDGAVPGTQRWLAFEANRTAHAWVLRHGGEPRPWIVCVHGYGMGTGGLDLWAFEVEWLHRHLRPERRAAGAADARPALARPPQRSGVLRRFAPELRTRRGAIDVGSAAAPRVDPCPGSERASESMGSRSAATPRRYSHRSRRISPARSPASPPPISCAVRHAS